MGRAGRPQFLQRRSEGHPKCKQRAQNTLDRKGLCARVGVMKGVMKGLGLIGTVSEGADDDFPSIATLQPVLALL